MVGRREDGGLGQQRPQTAEASRVLTPVSEEPTETQGPPSLREPRASCETATAVEGEATPANPAAGPTAPAVRPLPRILPAGPLELPPRRPRFAVQPSAPLLRVLRAGAGRPGRGSWACGVCAVPASSSGASPRPRTCCCCPAPLWGSGATSSPALPVRSPYCLGPGVKKETYRPPPTTSVTQEPPIPRALRAHGARRGAGKSRRKGGRPWLTVPRGERERGPPCHRDTSARTEGT